MPAPAKAVVRPEIETLEAVLSASHPTKMRWFPSAPTISKRSRTQVRNRCLQLFVLSVPLIAWMLCGTFPTSPEHSDEAVVAHKFEEPRRLDLNYESWEPEKGMQHGYHCLTASEYKDHQEITFWIVRKRHLTMGGEDGSGCASGAGPCLKWKPHLIMYISGMFYMFIAMAIICDEFFVPSLEMFVDHFGISMDVAGATFMAAGGSMPELFVSLISVFDGTDVGFAGIVGSAVFNVLFVIAVCALASKEPLQLTAWPLARDCTFYIIGLALVAIFFKGSSPDTIEWWEALILFFWYIFYCSFMKVNETVKQWVDSRWSSRAVSPEPEEALKAKAPYERDSRKKTTVSMAMPSSFRGGIIQLLTQHAHIMDTAGIAVVTEFKGSLQEVFREMDGDNDGCIDEAEFSVFMQKLGWKTPQEVGNGDKEPAATELWKRMPRTTENLLSFEAFKKWYMVSEARVEIEVRRVFEKLDQNSDGAIDGDEIRELLKSLGHHPTQADLEAVFKDIRRFGPDGERELGRQEADNAPEGEPAEAFEVKFEQFEKWYIQSVFCKAHQKTHQMEAKEEQGFTIDWPEDATWSQLFWYLFTYPLCAAMFCSLPDVRRPGMEGKVGWAILEFLLSLVWIAIFSIAMYECLVVCSNTMNIPPPAAAVTILAAGTSVPDLLSSYIVARQGEGDMAVSSSIGSNIFDITVGLPIPWLAFCIVRGRQGVKVSAANLYVSIIVLMIMLAAVILTVIAMRWKMTRGMGGVMFLLYIIFLIQDLLQQLPEGNPVL